MVNVTNRPNVHVRLTALEFLLGHLFTLVRSDCNPARTFASTSLENSGFRVSFRNPDLQNWSGGRDLNPQPSPWKSETLPLSYPRSVLLNSLPPAPKTPSPRRTRLRINWSLGPGLNR